MYVHKYNVDLFILAGLLEDSLDRFDLRCHLVLVIVGGAHLNVKVTIYLVPDLIVYLVVDHLGGLSAHGSHNLVTGLVCLDTNPIPGRLSLTILKISSQFICLFST